jgi:hypothetical protein
MFGRNRILAAPMLLTGALALGACGSDDKDKGGESSEKSVSPQTAVAEIGQTRTGLDKGLAAYKAGDAKKADEIVAETYVQHFEHVEAPLAKKDGELKEKLESSISAQIRAQIKRKAPSGRVEGLVKRTEADLNTAEAKLK